MTEKGPESVGLLEGDCILWTGAGSKPSKKKPNPSGIVRKKDKWRKHIVGKTPARHFWEIHYDRPVPTGMQVGHVCPNSLCINIKHLVMGTNSAISIMFGAQGRLKRVQKTHCKAGHPLEGENLYIAHKPNGTVDRSCRICRNRVARDLARKKFGHTPREPRKHPDMHETSFFVTDKQVLDHFATVTLPTLRRHRTKYWKRTYPTKKEFKEIKERLLRKKKCLKGTHSFTKENTLVYWNKTDGRWNRMCRECANKRFRMDQRKRHGFGTIKKYRSELGELNGVQR